MIRKLMATTALATLVASGAYAQDTTAPAQPAPAAQEAPAAAPVVTTDKALMTNIIGETVYNGAGDDAENIGKVTDVVFDKDGKAKSAVIGVGGFLGIGDKDVEFDYGKLQWAEKNGDRWLVAQTTKDELTAQAAFDPTPYEPVPPAPSTDTTMAPSGGTAPSTDTTMAPANGQTSAQTDTTMAPSGGTAPSTDTTMAPSTQAQNAPAVDPAKEVKPDGLLASNIVGETVYNGTGDDAENIGDVNDIVLSKDGKAEQLVIGVGGFLGLGEKSVAYDFAKAKWAEKNGDRWIVAETTKDELTAQPDFDRKAFDPAPAPATAATETAPSATPMAAAPADNAAQPAPSTDTAQNAPADTSAAPADTTTTAAIDKTTLTELPADKISADELIGTTVYGANDANVGKIGDVVLSTDNGIDAVVIDVGGFLGIGSKPVAVGMDKLKFMTDKDGNKYLYTNFTKEQLEAQAAYDKGSYAEKRDEQRLIVQ